MKRKTMYYLGIDIGSLSCDAVVINDNDEIIASSVVPTGARNLEAIARARDEVIHHSNIDPANLAAIVATGYGRDRVEDRLASVTEITCHGRGIQKLLPKTDVLIDIGGQDSKVIRFDQNGLVEQFAMNDKCVAGTGRFLEAMAHALEVDIDQLGDMGEGATGNMTLSSMCTVFAESEVVSLIAEGIEVAEIVNGLHRSIANRTQMLVKRVASNMNGLRISMSGGVAHNMGVVKALGAVLSCEVAIPPKPDIVGAYGAALIAKERTGCSSL
ncbi:acyl-CoA dehydratase activase [Thermodesulfobacteriota bacterium]